MTEQAIQRAISDYLTGEGYYVIKLIKTTVNGIPDLLAIKGDTVLFSDAHHTLFVEVKKPGGRLSRLQRFRIEQLQQRGIDVVVAFSVNDVKTFLSSN